MCAAVVVGDDASVGRGDKGVRRETQKQKSRLKNTQLDSATTLEMAFYVQRTRVMLGRVRNMIVVLLEERRKAHTTRTWRG